MKVNKLRWIKKRYLFLQFLIFAGFFQPRKKTIDLPSQSSCHQPAEIVKTNQINRKSKTTSDVKIELPDGRILRFNKKQPSINTCKVRGGVLPGTEGFTVQPVRPGSPATKAFSKLQGNKGKVGPGQSSFNTPSLGICPKAPSGRVTPEKSKSQQDFEENLNNRKSRIDQLKTDPQRGVITEKSIDEATAILQAESAGLVKNPRRPSDLRNQPNLDFITDGPGPYRYADIKTPANFGDLDIMAIKIGRKSVLQKGGTDSVLHIIDLKNIPSAQKARFQQNVIKESKGSAGFEFINNN